MPAQINLDSSNLVWRQGTNQVAVQDGHLALLRALVAYAGGKSSVGTVTYSGTGDGLIDDIDGGVDAPSETWTIAFTDANNYTVTGSVSGAQAGGSVGNNYTTSGDPLTSLISFRIDAGATPFVSSDAFTIPVTVGALSGQAEQWVLDRWSPFTTAGNGFNAIDDIATAGTTGALIWHGQGNGDESFPAGIQPIATPASQIWNWKMRAYTGFSPTHTWDANLGASDAPVYKALWDNDMTYWFVVNARRIVVATVVSTTMHTCYMGAMLPFASPAEWPFPMCIVAEKDDEEAWNSNDSQFTQGIMSAANDNGYLRDQAGVWLDFDGNQVACFPFNSDMRGVWDNMENHPNDDNQLIPLTLVSSTSTSAPLSTNHTFGVLDGCFAVTGFNITPQTVLTINSVDYLVINDIFRTERDDFWALRLS